MKFSIFLGAHSPATVCFVRRLAPWLIASVIAFGCNAAKEDPYQPKAAAAVQPATVAAGQEQTLLPLRVGNQWTYSVQAVRARAGQQEDLPTKEMTWRITAVTPEQNGNKATIEIEQDGRVVDRQAWLVNSQGIFQLSVGLTPTAFSSPMPIVKFPVREGNVFSWEGTGSSPLGVARQSAKSTVLGAQEVDTEMGRHSAIPVESRSTYRNDKREAKSVSTVWLTPGVGIVRYRQETVSGQAGAVLLLKLKGSSLMKS